MKRLIFVLFITLFSCFPSWAKPVLTHGDYEVVREAHETLVVLHQGQEIYRATVRHEDDYSLSPLSVSLVYGSLTPRGGTSQPEPWDDITGDGHPDLIFMESASAGSAYGSIFWVTVVSLAGEQVIEAGGIKGSGEILYFKDWDGDGIPEFVNTDNERRFLFDRSGMPISDRVWRYDTAYPKYFQAAEMVVTDPGPHTSREGE